MFPDQNAVSRSPLTTRAVEPYRAVRTRTHKYILWESKQQALFDLRSDPGEERDLAGESGQAKVLARMRELLAQRIKETSDPAGAWLG